MSVTIKPATRTTFSGTIPVLVPLYGNCETWQFSADGEWVCGRGSDCKLPIAVKGVSERHCNFILRSGILTVQRLEGHIWINDLPVPRQAALMPGDTLSIGPVSFRIDETRRTESAAPAVKTEAPAPISSAEPVFVQAVRTADALPLNLSTPLSEKQSASASEPLTAALLLALQKHQQQTATPAPMISVSGPSAADERLALVESRERMLEQRELHIQELSRFAQEREHAMSERGAAQDERLKVLNQQKEEIEQSKLGLNSLRDELQKQKEELQRRIQAFSGRETQLMSQLESTATSYAQLEQTRVELTERTDRVQSREQELERRRRIFEEHADVVKQEKLASATQAEQHESLRLQLETLRTELTDQKASVETQTAELARKSDELARQKREVEESSGRATRSVEQLNAIAAEREQATRAREAAAATLQQLTDARVVNAKELARLESLSQEITARQTRLESEEERVRDEKNERDKAQDCLNAQLASELARLTEERAAIEITQATMLARQSALDVEQAQLASHKQQQNLWQAELDARHAELAGRLVVLKAARAAAAEIASAQADAASFSSEETASIEQQRVVLLTREIQLAQAESRLDELQRAVSMQMRNADAEREALQSSHKDLICERNSLMQSSQDIQSRSANVIDRETAVVQQMDELRFRFDALNQQEAELRKLDAELNTRASELHHRVLQFKQESHDFRAQQANTPTQVNPDSEVLITPAMSSSVEEALQILLASEAEEKFEQVKQERDALLTAVRELQMAMMNARGDVEDAHRIRQDAAQQEQSLAGLYQSLEERSGQLQLMESHLRQASEQAEELQAQIAELNRQLENKQTSETLGLLQDTTGRNANSFAAFSGDQNPSDGAENFRIGENAGESDVELHLLQELESMRNELQAARTVQSASILKETADLDTQTQLLLDQICELQAQLHAAVQTVEGEDPVNLMQVDELRSRIDRMESSLRDRDELIIELRTRLQKLAQQDAGIQPDPAAITNLENVERELDRRVKLLDEREDELRVRIRKVTQTEEDIESQRRQLLDARQQLEIARSEVQAALKQHSAVQFESEERDGDHARTRSSNEVFSSAILEDSAISGSVTLESANETAGTDTFNIEDGDASQDLRAELANLFGLKKSPPREPVAETRPTSQLPDFFDLSEPTGDANTVELSFGANMADIEHPFAPNGSEDSSPPREENSDDFVRDYMEQLLSRSRKAAGNSLPSELKPASQPAANAPQNIPQPKKAAETKGAPRTKSYIDEYMSGGFKELDGQPAAPEAPAADRIPSSLEPTIPRLKVDVQKLRENMNSFRTLSAQSTENALINHAMRTERLSINGRIMLTFVMIFMSVFLAIANRKGIIDHPSLIWITVVGAFASVGELIRKLLSVKSRCKVALTPDNEEIARKAHSSSHLPIDEVTNAAVVAHGTQPMPEIVPEEIVRQRQISQERAVLGDDAVGRKETDRTEYFEL